MTRFEFAAIFIGIVVGLALANILASVQKLMEAGRRIRWDWLAPTMAASAALMTLGIFWHQWVQSQTNPPFHTYFLYQLPNAIAFFVLYLTCAATLPEEVPEGGLDLRQYYFDNRRRMWGLFCTTFVLNLSTWAVALVRTGSTGVLLQLNAVFILINVAGLLLSIVSLTVRAVWWHRIAAPGLTLLFLLVYGPMPLS